MTDDPIQLRFGDSREDGPGGALVLVRHIDFDPRDVHEMQAVESYSVYDGLTGVSLFATSQFGLYTGTAHFADDGSLAITIGDLKLTIDPATRTWAMDYDGWQSHLLDGDQAKIDTLVRPALRSLHPPPAQSTQAQVQMVQTKVRQWLELLLFVGAIAFAGWLLVTYGWKRYSRPTQTALTAVNAWLVTCPDMNGLMVFSINPDGTLSAPPEVSPAKLRPVGGEDNRFALSDLTISFDGREVIIERDGQSITCGPPAPQR